MADTQIDELRLDITVEDKTSGESSDKKVKNLASAISRLNKNLQAFDNAKFTKVFDNMSKGLDPFVKKIEKVSNALANLATIVSKGGLDKAVKEVSGKVPELKTEPASDSDRKSEPVKAIQGQAEGLQATTNNAKSLSSSILDITSKADILRKKLEMINAEMQKGGLSEKQLVQLKSQQLSIQEQIAKAEGKKQKVPLSNLLKSFGRIAMYRAVRRTIQEITQAFMESIDGIARYNSEFRDTMGNLQSSLAKAKASIGVSFYQVLIMLEPVITQIANGIANLGNSLAKVTANMRGVATYTKINTDYMKEYQSATQGTLLAFDTFTTLNAGQGTDYSKMFETGEDALDESGFNEIDNILKDVLTIIKEALKVFRTLFDELSPSLKLILDTALQFLPAVDKLVRIVAPVLNRLIETILPSLMDLVETILPVIIPIIEQIADALNSVMYLLEPIINLVINSVKMMVAIITLDFRSMFDAFTDGWKDIGDFFVRVWKTIANSFASLINSIANIFITFVNICIDGLNMILSPIDAISGIFGGEVKIPHWDAKVNWQPYAYANGGMFEGAGTMYTLAGKSGAEVVAQGSAGTGVLNVDQFADAMVSALVRYGAARDTGNGTTIVLDGNKVGQLVASNVGFRNEANRRNAGLNWK